jgi:hypothetical protein
MCGTLALQPRAPKKNDEKVMAYFVNPRRCLFTSHNAAQVRAVKLDRRLPSVASNETSGAHQTCASQR